MTLRLQLGAGGETVSSDENANTEHNVLLKLADGTLDSSTVIEAGNGLEANALLVTLAEDSDGVVKLAAGSAAIGEASIGSATTGSANLTKRADGAHTSSAVGVMGLAVRKAAPVALSDTNEDYESLQISGGRIWTTWGNAKAYDQPVGSGPAILLGIEASETDGTDPGEVTEGQQSRLQADLSGILLVDEGAPDRFYAEDNQATAQTKTVLKTAPTNALFITDIAFFNGATPGEFRLVEDSAGSSVEVFGPVYLGVNQSYRHEFDTPLKLTDAVDLSYSTVSVTTHSVFVAGYGN